MKIRILILFLTLISPRLFGQWDWKLNFEDTGYYSRVTIDTNTNQNNIWQIGQPIKPIFNNAFSPTNAIITDTMNAYPINDTSSFIIKHVRNGFPEGVSSLLLDFHYKLNTDTISDYGIIEASIDNGLTWINLLTDDSIYNLFWISPKPILSGNTTEWQHFSIELSELTYTLGYYDTLLYKFTFISDSIQTYKDGWIIDNFVFNDTWQGTNKNISNNLISIFPNPVSNKLKVNLLVNDRNQKIQILNNLGQVLYNNSNNTEQIIDISQFSNGVYFLEYWDSKNFSTVRFVVQH
jgi:hypothetical protein